MLSAFFNPPREDLELQDHLFDSVPTNSAETYINTAKKRLVSVFELRGATELSVDLVTPAYPQIYRPEDGKRPVKYVDESGILVSRLLIRLLSQQFPCADPFSCSWMPVYASNRSSYPTITPFLSLARSPEKELLVTNDVGPYT